MRKWKMEWSKLKLEKLSENPVKINNDFGENQAVKNIVRSKRILNQIMNELDHIF